MFFRHQALALVGKCKFESGSFLISFPLFLSYFYFILFYFIMILTHLSTNQAQACKIGLDL